ncbi:hypothetical protein CASFOL_037920 [Castilleja foliolosa]|uniref:Uncharacterized protein n=1 Tax=Castilleja foliolosa TaxID=1961234 RepID=A0ABD3BK56_9LAMI
MHYCCLDALKISGHKRHLMDYEYILGESRYVYSYMLFWLVIFACKFRFAYFLQARLNH